MPETPYIVVGSPDEPCLVIKLNGQSGINGSLVQGSRDGVKGMIGTFSPSYFDTIKGKSNVNKLKKEHPHSTNIDGHKR
jgi:hypothetical protein